MTKSEKLLTLEAMRDEAKEMMENATSGASNQYYKGKLDALNDSIAVMLNRKDGNAIKDVYLRKEDE